jgi:hypothetical protein
MAGNDHQVRAGMDVYDADDRYVGMVTRVYPVPARFARGAAALGCFKVRRGPLPLLGPKPLLIPFDAIRSVAGDRVTLTVARDEAARWAQGRQGRA